MKPICIAHMGGNNVAEFQLGHEMKAQIGKSTKLLTI
jgi:hypothetical protein